MTKIIAFPVKKRVCRWKPTDPKGPMGGVAVINKATFTKAIAYQQAA